MLKALPLHLYESIQFLMSLITKFNIVLGFDFAIFTTRLSPQAVCFVQTGCNTLSNSLICCTL